MPTDSRIKAKILPVQQDFFSRGAHVTVMTAQTTPERATGAGKRNFFPGAGRGGREVPDCLGFLNTPVQDSPVTQHRIHGLLYSGVASAEESGHRATSPTYRGRGAPPPTHFTTYTPGGDHEKCYNLVPCATGTHHSLRAIKRPRRDRQPAVVEAQTPSSLSLVGTSEEREERSRILCSLMSMSGKTDRKSKLEYRNFVVDGLNKGWDASRLTVAAFESQDTLGPRALFTDETTDAPATPEIQYRSLRPAIG